MFVHWKRKHNLFRITRKRRRDTPCRVRYLLRTKVTEHELILARVGKFNLTLDEIKMLTICPKHRHNLAQYWRPLKTCQYPNHEGQKIALHCKNPVNWQMAQEIQTMFITVMQVGSRENFFLFVTRSLKQLL